MNSLFVCGHYSIDLSIPQVMGVINVTPNSFSEVGRFHSFEHALNHARTLVDQGATFIDVGGEPTHPGVHPVVSLQQELDRVIPLIEILSKELPIPISVDTSKSEVMREALARGASMINDVRALLDPLALQVVAKSKAAVCLMHMLYPYGQAANKQSKALDENPILQIKAFLQERVTACLEAGIASNRIVIDPGIGHGNFGKNLAQNLLLLNKLDEFKSLNFPILIGVSRKTFIGELLNKPVEQRLYGSLGAALIAVLRGASIVRVHDVQATVEAIKVVMAINSSL